MDSVKIEPLMKLGCTYKSELTGNVYVPTDDFFYDKPSGREVQLAVCLKFRSSEFVEADEKAEEVFHFTKPGEILYVDHNFVKNLKLKKDYNK